MTPEQRRLLLIEAERIRLAQAQNAPVAQEEGGFFSGIGNRLIRGADTITEGVGTSLEVFGAPEWGGAVRRAIDAPTGPSDSEQFINADGEGFGWDHLPGAAVEQAPQYAASKAAAVSGAAAGSVFGPVGTAVGAVAAPAALGVAQQAGPIALERAQNNGRSEPNWVDKAVGLGTGAVSGVIDALSFKGGSGIAGRAVKEGLTEGTQSVVEQAGGSIGTDSGLEVSAKQAIGEGILGATGSVGVEGVSRGAQEVINAPKTIESIRWDDERNSYDENDVELAKRIRDVEGGRDLISNVGDTGGDTSAQGVAKTVLADLRERSKVIVSELKARAKSPDAEARLLSLENELERLRTHISPVNEIVSDLNAVMGQSRNLKASVSDYNINRIEKVFQGDPQAQRLVGLLRQIQKITPFTEAKGDLGGLNRFTRLLDPTDGRSGVGRLGFTLHGTAGLAGVGSLAGGVALNRLSRGVDSALNTRSRVKRYTESVERSVMKGKTPNVTNEERVSELQRLAAEAKAKTQAAEQKAAQGQIGPQPNLSALTTNAIFEGGAIPDTEFFKPFRLWKDATGLEPKAIYDALVQLEQGGVLPQGTAQRFRYDVRSFDTRKDEVYQLQELVRQRFNPDYSSAKAAAQAALKDPATAGRRLDASKTGISPNRAVMKAKEGARAWVNVTSDIEARKASLDGRTYSALLKLREAMNRGDILAADREKLMEDTLSALFTNPVEYDHWYKVFAPLAAIGNDYVPDKWENRQDPEWALNRKVRQVKADSQKWKKTKGKRRRAGEPPEPANVNAKPSYSSPANRNEAPVRYPFSDSKINSLIEKANGVAEPEDTPTPATKDTEAKTPKPTPALDESKAKTRPGGDRRGVAKQVQDRIDAMDLAVKRAAKFQGALEARIRSLAPTVEGKVEALVYEFASDQLTVNMLIDGFASKHGVPPEQAARMVYETLKGWEDAGAIKLVSRYKQNALRKDDENVRDAKGNRLHVMHLEVLDPDLKGNLEIAKAVNMTARMVNVDGPDVDYTVDNLSHGHHRAIKDYDDAYVDESFQPLLNTVNDLRRTPMAANPKMLKQIEDGLKGSSGHMPIKDQLQPKTVDGETDNSPMYAVSQLLYQLGTDGRREDTTFHQEWFAGANGRIYSKNGQVHSQGGDLMKGIIRAEQAAPLGGRPGLDMMLHSFGNILGFDKEAPKVRREVIFRDGYIDALLDFSKDPFGRTRLSDKTKKGAFLKDIVENGEGFFQVLNVANEVSEMVEWARQRHKKLAKDPANLLKDPKVQQDIAENYKTDFIVQLDANNNAYQIAGLLMGAQRLLQATGLIPRDPNANPDETKGADIYTEPGKIVYARIPELKALDLPDSTIRKLFKKPIGTYLYASAFQSRRAAIEDELKKIAKGAPIFGYGDMPGLIQIPDAVAAGVASEQGHTFLLDPIDDKPAKAVRRKIVQVDGGWRIDTDTTKSKRKFEAGKVRFDTFEEALAEAYGRDFYARVDRELVSTFEGMYPEIRDYLKFAEGVSKIVRDRGEEKVNVPSPDGMVLQYGFKTKHAYAGLPVERTYVDKKTGETKTFNLNLGYELPDYKVTGRGLAAFMTHQIDAFILRESYRQLGGRTGLVTFNPIHDSYGFHPSDSARGQETVLQVMQSMGNAGYNIFDAILRANGIDPAEFVAGGGVIPNRHGVEPLPAQRIPTALS